MKTKFNILGLVMVLFTLMLLPGCNKLKEEMNTAFSSPESASIDEDSGKKPFVAFSSLELSYIDKDGEKKTISFFRDESVMEILQDFERRDFQNEEMTPVEVKSCETLRDALKKLYGKDVDQDTTGAVVLLQKLANVKKPYTPDHWKEHELRCHAIAKYILGLCYQDGVGVPKDPIKGLSLVKEACFYDQFHWDDHPGWDSDLDDVTLPISILEMAVRFLSGNGVNPNMAKGMYFLDGADDRGNAVADGIQSKLEAALYEMPERFQHCDSAKQFFRAAEGFSILDVTQMLAREKGL